MRAIGIVRVSQREEDDGGHSPEVQVRAMIKHAADQGWELHPDDILDENIDVRGKVRKASGGADLSDRPKLLHAVETIERGPHKIILAERFDRFFRDLDVQREVISRVEAAGGRIETIRQGAISHATAEAELSANLNGAIAQYTRRTAKDRSWDAVEVAIEEGKIPWSQTAPGYQRSDDSKLTPDLEVAPVIQEAFRMRMEGATIAAVRSHLLDHGIDRSYHGTTHLLRDRVYVGEIHFGTHTPNLEAHDPIIERRTFERVQKKVISRGRKAKSDRLLARLGVVRCANCGARMTVGTVRDGSYPFYRCPPTGNCSTRVTISAAILEKVVWQATKDRALDMVGRASAETSYRDACAGEERTRTTYEAAMVALKDFNDHAAVQRLRDLKAEWESAKDHKDRVETELEATTVVISADDMDDAPLEKKRKLIAAVLPRVLITSEGRGSERVVFPPR